jgi:hypothetical protein
MEGPKRERREISHRFAEVVEVRGRREIIRRPLGVGVVVDEDSVGGERLAALAGEVEHVLDLVVDLLHKGGRGLSLILLDL